MVIPIAILSAVIFGSLIRAFWGWLDSGEKFNARKFAATIIVSIFAALGVGATMLGSDIIVSDSGFLVVVLMALLAGWGIDDGLKQLGKMRKK